MNLDTQFLFAYGTLKSDQPEHAAHCVKPLSITPAKVAGRIWRLLEGYPILQVDPKFSLLDASSNMKEDWTQGLELASKGTPDAHDGIWIDGELFEYPLDERSLLKMDEWENFIPGIESSYQRRIIWIKDDQGANRIAWAYVCFEPPSRATLVERTSW